MLFISVLLQCAMPFTHAFTDDTIEKRVMKNETRGSRGSYLKLQMIFGVGIVGLYKMFCWLFITSWGLWRLLHLLYIFNHIIMDKSIFHSHTYNSLIYLERHTFVCVFCCEISECFGIEIGVADRMFHCFFIYIGSEERISGSRVLNLNKIQISSIQQWDIQ
jgi:hypothetical protein